MIRRFPRQATTKTFRSDKIHPVPVQFRQKHPFPYPPSNMHEFERWFHDTLKPEEITGDRIYLPIFWTSYWLKNGYGLKLRERQTLQAFINSLDRNKKFFSICQYDDGPLVDFKDLDIKIFGMSGGRIDYPIPLLCQPHKFQFLGIKKDIFCSFVGSDTHPIRRALIKEFEGKPDCYVTMKKHSLEDYCKILARSVFSLCPRGYGKSSFRISESIQYKAIPLYVSDEFINPYNEPLPILQVPSEELGRVYRKLYIGNVELLQTQIESSKHLFTYEGCKQKILENI